MTRPCITFVMFFILASGCHESETGVVDDAGMDTSVDSNSAHGSGSDSDSDGDSDGDADMDAGCDGGPDGGHYECPQDAGQWLISIGGLTDEWETGNGLSLVSTRDNAFAIFTDKYGIKIDHSGKEVWTKSYFIDEETDRWVLVTQAENSGNGIYLGLTSSAGGGDAYTWHIEKVDEDGSPVTEWGAGHGDGWTFFGIGTVIATSDNGAVLSISYSDGYDYFVLKVRHDGKTEWGYRIGGSNIELAIDGIETDGSHIVLVDSDFNVYKMDDLGRILWVRSLEHGKHGLIRGYGHAVIHTRDNNIVAVGSIFSQDDCENENFYECSSHHLVVKMNLDGDVVWQRQIAGGGRVSFPEYEVIETRNSDIIIVSSIEAVSEDKSDAIIIRMAEDGSVKWQKFISSDQPVWGRDVIEYCDDGIIVACVTPRAHTSPVLVAKLNSDGEIPGGCDLLKDKDVSVKEVNYSFADEQWTQSTYDVQTFNFNLEDKDTYRDTEFLCPDRVAR